MCTRELGKRINSRALGICIIKTGTYMRANLCRMRSVGKENIYIGVLMRRMMETGWRIRGRVRGSICGGKY